MNSLDLKKVFIVTAVLVFFLVIVHSWDDHVLYNPSYFTDLLTLIASENFLEHGFTTLKFLPVFDPQIDPGNIAFYTHYPPLSVIFNALLMKTGISSLPLLRLFPILAGALFLLFWIRTVRLLVDETAAYISGLFIVTSSLFTKWLPSLFCYSYDYLLVSIGVYAFLRACRSTDVPAQKRYLALCWVSTWIQSLMSFEFILFLQTFYFGYALLYRPKLPRSFLFALPTAPLAGFALHLFQNFLVLGPAAVTDLASAFMARTQGMQAESSFGMLRYAELLGLRILRWYGLLPVALISWLVVHFLTEKTETTSTLRGHLRVLLLFFVCGAAWFIIFMEHSFVHFHELRQWLFFYALGASLFLKDILSRLSRLESPLKKSLIAVALIILFADHGARFGYGFFNEPRTLHGLVAFREIKETTSPRSRVFTNYAYETHCAYYSDRNCHPVRDISSLKEAEPRGEDLFLFAAEDRGAFLLKHVPLLGYLSKWTLHRSYVQADYSRNNQDDRFLKDPLFQHLAKTYPFKVSNGFYIFYLVDHG
jgi:hypothetical protein